MYTMFSRNPNQEPEVLVYTVLEGSLICNIITFDSYNPKPPRATSHTYVVQRNFSQAFFSFDLFNDYPNKTVSYKDFFQWH